MNALELMLQVIRDHTEESIWKGSVIEGYRHLGNTNRGAVGEDFVARYLESVGINVDQSDSRTDPTDMCIRGVDFEVKTASLGKNGSFQFNHIRLDGDWKYLLALGVCPNEIVFSVWRKGDVAEEKAGKLVPMAKGQRVTFKITKKLADMRPIEDLPIWIRNTL